jgi:hypothetical protein
MSRSKLSLACLGNCQTGGLVAALKGLLPDAIVHGWFLATVADREETEEELTKYDVIVANVWDEDERNPLSRTRIQERCRKVIYMYPIIFTGFHPDVIWVHHCGNNLEGPLENLHSAIIAAAYSLGLDQCRAAKLFNSVIYSRLGYFDTFDLAKTIFLQQHSDEGYDLSRYFDYWLQAGVFMYTPNHPRVDVLGTMATLAAARAGLIDADTRVPDGLPDDLAETIQWPLYPEIARRIGIRGGTTFLRGVHQVEPGAHRQFDLPQLIAQFYSFYATIPDLTFDTGRIVSMRDRLREALV